MSPEMTVAQVRTQHLTKIVPGDTLVPTGTVSPTALQQEATEYVRRAGASRSHERCACGTYDVVLSHYCPLRRTWLSQIGDLRNFGRFRSKNFGPL
jgi:hypothetical protein